MWHLSLLIHSKLRHSLRVSCVGQGGGGGGQGWLCMAPSLCSSPTASCCHSSSFPHGEIVNEPPLDAISHTGRIWDHRKTATGAQPSSYEQFSAKG